MWNYDNYAHAQHVVIMACAESFCWSFLLVSDLHLLLLLLSQLLKSLAEFKFERFSFLKIGTFFFFFLRMTFGINLRGSIIITIKNKPFIFASQAPLSPSWFMFADVVSFVIMLNIFMWVLVNRTEVLQPKLIRGCIGSYSTDASLWVRCMISNKMILNSWENRTSNKS